MSCIQGVTVKFVSFCSKNQNPSQRCCPNIDLTMVLRGVSSYLKLGGQVVMWPATAAARRRLLFYQNLVGNCPPCPSHHLRPWYIYIPYFIISTVALSVGLLAVPLYILVKAYKTKVCPKNPIPEFNTEAQKKINDLETETLKLNEEIKKH